MRRTERGGILVRTAIFFLVLGLAAWDGGAIVIAMVQADRIAGNAADESALEFSRSQSTDKARDVAQRMAEISEANVSRFVVRTDREVVEVTVTKRARTLLAHRIGPLKRYREADATQTSKIP